MSIKNAISMEDSDVLRNEIQEYEKGTRQFSAAALAEIRAFLARMRLKLRESQ